MNEEEGKLIEELSANSLVECVCVYKLCEFILAPYKSLINIICIGTQPIQ